MLRRPFGPRPRVRVVSANHELRQTLADACELLGYPAEAAGEWSEGEAAGTATGPAIWDVPVLEPGWPRALARRVRHGGAVVVLLGFASRTMVQQARDLGASACLELPCDVLDLGHVLDRITTPRGEPAHRCRHRPRHDAGPREIRAIPAAATKDPFLARTGRRWPGRAGMPKMRGSWRRPAASGA